jgi:hypothetical protein
MILWGALLVVGLVVVLWGIYKFADWGEDEE